MSIRIDTDAWGLLTRPTDGTCTFSSYRMPPECWASRCNGTQWYIFPPCSRDMSELSTEPTCKCLPWITCEGDSLMQPIYLELIVCAELRSEEWTSVPLSDTSSTSAFSGSNVKASSIALRLIELPWMSLLFAWSTVAFSKIGLLLIFVSTLIRASDSAVEVCTRLSSLSAFKIFLKMESWSWVGVMKTTYSSDAQISRCVDRNE